MLTARISFRTITSVRTRGEMFYRETCFTIATTSSVSRRTTTTTVRGVTLRYVTSRFGRARARDPTDERFYPRDGRG